VKKKDSANIQFGSQIATLQLTELRVLVRDRNGMRGDTPVLCQGNPKQH
jgi:hypothetical protein